MVLMPFSFLISYHLSHFWINETHFKHEEVGFDLESDSSDFNESTFASSLFNHKLDFTLNNRIDYAAKLLSFKRHLVSQGDPHGCSGPHPIQSWHVLPAFINETRWISWLFYLIWVLWDWTWTYFESGSRGCWIYPRISLDSPLLHHSSAMINLWLLFLRKSKISLNNQSCSSSSSLLDWGDKTWDMHLTLVFMDDKNADSSSVE